MNRSDFLYFLVTWGRIAGLFTGVFILAFLIAMSFMTNIYLGIGVAIISISFFLALLGVL